MYGTVMMHYRNIKKLRILANYLNEYYQLNNIRPDKAMFLSVDRDLGIDPEQLVLMLNELSLNGTVKLNRLEVND